MDDPRAAEGVEHLQRAARELLQAARSFLDVVEDVVEDPERLTGAAAGLVDVVRSGLGRQDAPWVAAAWDRGDDAEHPPHDDDHRADAVDDLWGASDGSEDPVTRAEDVEDAPPTGDDDDPAPAVPGPDSARTTPRRRSSAGTSRVRRIAVD